MPPSLSRLPGGVLSVERLDRNGRFRISPGRVMSRRVDCVTFNLQLTQNLFKGHSKHPPGLFAKLFSACARRTLVTDREELCGLSCPAVAGGAWAGPERSYGWCQRAPATTHRATMCPWERD